MEMIFRNASVKSRLRAISSKSEAHRLLICAALGDKACRIICTDTNADIDATVSCLNSLGADIKRISDVFTVEPIRKVIHGQALDCNESGSTLRFMLPVAAALGADCSFHMRGRLSQRPLSPLYEILSDNGVSLSPQGENPLKLSGQLSSGDYSIAANVSSQYISGLLFALSICEGKSSLTLEGKIESAPYIDLTVDALKAFGVKIEYVESDHRFEISGHDRLSSPTETVVGGDWSNAAFLLVAGAIGKNPVSVSGLDLSSRQGDKEILAVLERMGACIAYSNGEITVHPSKLISTDVDASQIPDLVPIIATAASVASGTTKIYNAGRLRLKESDRIESVCATLTSLGADIESTDDGVIIHGRESLVGGEVDSYNDHRIAMSAAVASLACETEVKINRFEAINKSYPSFTDVWEIKD
jgi:3-phosphoshikimate 1-carboxyvinyltransferase